MKSSIFLIVSFMIAAVVLAGCSSDNTNDPVSAGSSINKDNQLQVELSRVRAATAKYQNIDQAIQDNYADINLYVPHMGWHYLNSTVLDSTFDMEHPELLVYMDKPNGGLKLVAVEYAVPLDLSPQAPEGFTGSEDEWDVNSAFQLWTLHCWVWYNNPDGIFAEYNPRVN
ncbi:MAG TPA: hypothetical protein VKD08_01185 [Ignavibacteriaceae bacterium]|jgi:hypothetical protein|nr:hypothetical protein [Ignavibacteriaceae bacterium]